MNYPKDASGTFTIPINDYHFYNGIWYKLIFNSKDVPIWKLAHTPTEDSYAMIFSAWGYSLVEAREKFREWVDGEEKFESMTNKRKTNGNY